MPQAVASMAMCSQRRKSTGSAICLAVGPCAWLPWADTSDAPKTPMTVQSCRMMMDVEKRSAPLDASKDGAALQFPIIEPYLMP